MRKIGAGLQFNVYDLGNGKVLKAHRTRIQMYFTNLLWEPYLIFAPWILKRKINQAIKDRKDSISKLKKNLYDQSLLGDLTFENNNIIQDKVKPLKYFLNNKNFKKILDKYFEFILECWREGFSDKIYNLDTNNGIDKNGEIILMDIGELSFNKEEIRKDILSKRWEHSGFYKRRLKKSLKKYYSNKAENILTLKNLNKYWESN